MKKIFRRKFFWLPLFFIICIALLFSLGLDDVFFSEHEVRLGLIAELSGSMKAVGTSSFHAVTLAVNEVNAAGGVMINKTRYPIHLITLDNKSSVAETEKDVFQLQNEHVAAIIGPNASVYAIPAANIAEKNNMVLISPWSTDNRTTLINNKQSLSIFRAAFTESFQEKALAYFASNTLQADRAAIIYDARAQVLKQQSDYFSGYFKANHGMIIDMIGFTNPQNLTQKLQLLIEKKPDVIFLPAYAQDTKVIVEQMHNLNIKIPVIGTDAWGGQQIINTCGKMCTGYFVGTHMDEQTSNQITRDFIATYQKQFKILPDDVAGLSYDATNIILHAISSANSTSHDDIAQAIHKIENFNGVTGYISFSQRSNDPEKNIYINKIENNKLTIVQSISPNDMQK